MIINHNITALNTHRQMGAATNAQASSMEKLSSGMRINSAKDDAAGLAISEKMRAQIRGLDQASKNAQDGISLMQTAEGGLNETQDILQRMRELAVQSSNDTNDNGNDRAAIQKEVDELANELTRINKDTTFNGKNVFTKDGTAASFKLHIGADSNSEELTVSIGAFDATSLSVATAGEVAGTSVLPEYQGAKTFTATDSADASYSITLDAAGEVSSVSKAGVTQDIDSLTGVFTVDNDTKDSITFTGGTAADPVGPPATAAVGATVTAAVTGVEQKAGGINVSTQGDAKSAIDTINDAINKVSSERAQIGAWQNRLDHTINNLATSSENMTAAESRIRDVDMAKEMMEQTRNSILSQASQAMLAQANQQPQAVLQLLR